GSASGSSTRFRVPVNSATTRGRKIRGRTPATQVCGGRFRLMRNSASPTCRWNCPLGITTAVTGPANVSSADASWALALQTGRRRWHFQLVHQGIWDMDIPCAPILVDIVVNGRTIKAVAQPTKQAFLYVFNRETGAPIWPIEERPVAKGDVPGEWYSPTQPF